MAESVADLIRLWVEKNDGLAKNISNFNAERLTNVQ